MKFRELPQSLRLYILAHPFVLAPLVYLIAQQPGPDRWWLVGILVVCSGIFSTWKVELTVFDGRMTIGFAVVCLALLISGTHAAILSAVFGALIGSLVRGQKGSWKVERIRQQLYYTFFNIANCSLSCVGAALAYTGVMSVAADPARHVLGLVVFTAVYFGINTLGVSLAITFQQGLNWASVWQQNFLWTAPGFFASASAAAGIEWAFKAWGLIAFLLVPPLWVIYYSYKLYMERLHLFTGKLQQDVTHIQELNKLNQAIISSLAMAIDAKDRYTCSHINRVQLYAVALAEAAGLSGPDLEAVSTGALVHDIGKLGIPDHILGKPGKLTPEEFERIQSHVTIGAEILSPVPFPFPVVDVVLTHHERWDGLGYPNRMQGEEIPIGGRIISIVDVFDALTSNRPYRRAMSQDEALRILLESAGKQFDPRLVQLFSAVVPAVRGQIDSMEAEQKTQADSANTAIEGSFALSRISQAAAEMAAVCDVAHSLAEQETLDQIAAVVVDRGLGLLPADTAILYLKSTTEDDQLIAIAVEGEYRDKLKDMTIRIGEGVAGCVAGDGQPRVNVSAFLDVARRFAPEEAMELSAATAVPLVHGPETLGVLAVYTKAYSVLSEHHLHVLNILAEHAAGAIQNLRRFERNQELVFTDPLTGLANSRCLVRHLDRLLHPIGADGPTDPECFGVVMLDLDFFKDVNDTLGHLRGDDLLRTVADTLSRIGRPGDVVCRYAGDEFVLLLPGAAREQGERVASRVREAIDSLPAIEGVVKIGASVGVATFPDDGDTSRSLIHAADRRMYEDKFRRRRNDTRSSRAGQGLVGAGR